MHELMTILADAMPEENLVEQLEEELQHYKENVLDPHRFDKLATLCSLVVAKASCNQAGGAGQVLKDIEKFKMGKKLLDLGNQ